MKKGSINRKEIQVINFPTPRMGSNSGYFQKKCPTPFRKFSDSEYMVPTHDSYLHLSENFLTPNPGLQLTTPDVPSASESVRNFPTPESRLSVRKLSDFWVPTLSEKFPSYDSVKKSRSNVQLRLLTSEKMFQLPTQL